ncbi:hypothetical protein MMC30_000111 [Trapelia coarctata]|nr:hypothetical protein [Trapelia coarctata]
MAYNSHFNPDALPAHAEPDQAAQIIGQYNSQKLPSRPQPSPNTTSASPPIPFSYQNKPPPPVPPIQQQVQQHPQPQYPQQQPQQYPQPQYRRQSQNSSLNPYTNNNDSNHFSAAQNQRYYANPPSQNPPARSPPPPRSPIPPQGVGDASLFPLFKAVDKRGTGQLTEDELRAALVNGDFTSFDPQTVRMMIRMFDSDRSGTIGFDEFCGLWGFLAAWRTLFDRFDEDRSGTICFDEYSNALLSFGYHLTPQFVDMLYRIYDKKGTNSMSFDIFVQSCISLKRMTDVFKKYDTDRDGYITLSFEEFLTEILQQR